MLKSKSNSQGEQPIILRLSFKRQPLNLPTGYTIHPKQWDKSSGRPVLAHEHDYKNLQPWFSSLAGYIKVVKNPENGLVVSPEDIKKQWQRIRGIYDQMEEHKKEGQYFNSKRHIRFQDKLQELQKSQLLSYNYKRGLKSLENRLNAYKTKYTVDQQFIEEYTNHLLQANLSNATVQKYIKLIRKVCVACNEFQYKRLDFKSVLKPLKLVKKDTIVYLNPNELRALEELIPLPTKETAEPEPLESLNSQQSKSRDLFLFRCYTGLRQSEMDYIPGLSSDLKEFSLFISKSKHVRTVSLPAKAHAILGYWNYRLPLISQQKESKAMKELAERLKLNREIEVYRTVGANTDKEIKALHTLISTHVARKTFAMNVYSKTNDILFTSLKLGHSDTATTMNYLGISEKMKQYKMDELI